MESRREEDAGTATTQDGEGATTENVDEMINMDAESLEHLMALCLEMSARDLERMCEGLLRAATATQMVYHQRYPEEWQAWNDRVENGEVTLNGS
jgi:hypothetical protein